MGELDNCSNCGTLYVKTTRNVCQDCFKEEEKKFQLVYEFMKKRINRQATIPEIYEGTGVEEELIIKFVKENRLRASQFPNLTYPCDKCGKQIKEGRLCDSCSAGLATDLEIHSEREQLQRKKEERANRTYFAVDKGKK